MSKSTAGSETEKSQDQVNINNNSRQNPIMIANLFLERLQTGYETANIPLMVSLYNDPFVAVDVTREINNFYTASSFQQEIAKTLTGLTGIKCAFTEPQITAESDMIMICTMRTVTADQVSIIAKCLMLMILRKSFIDRQPWDYVVTDQILLKEEYVPKSDIK